MGNVIGTKYNICVPNPTEEEMKRSRTTSADEEDEEDKANSEQTGPMERLIAAASAGLESIDLTEAGKSETADLMCAHCHSMLFRVRAGLKYILNIAN